LLEQLNNWFIPSFVSLKLTRNERSFQPAYCVSESSGFLQWNVVFTLFTSNNWENVVSENGAI